MSTATPRRSSRTPHKYTPKMSERKKSLFSGDENSRESLTKHRRLPVVDSETDSDDCDLGIIGTLDSSSCDENDQNIPKVFDQIPWHETRFQKKKLKENHELKNFMKSPFTLKKYQTKYSIDPKCTGSLSTPATPHIHHPPTTPSSTHSCASAHTTSSNTGKARKSLASLIADTESCSSSLKDLNFDSDTGSDSKENTPTKPLRRSTRRKKKTPKLQSFKGVLLEQKKNISPMKTAVICLTKIDMNDITSPYASMISPTQMLKTPQNPSEIKDTPPKLGHNRRSVLEIEESPESTCSSEKSYKRLHYDDMLDNGPVSKHPRLAINSASKAKTSLFNCDRLKEILSTKSFYGKPNPDLNTNISKKINKAIEITTTHKRRLFVHSHSQRRKRKPGEINMGVKHRIRKPKVIKHKMVYSKGSINSAPKVLDRSTTSNKSMDNNESMRSQTSVLSQDEKADPFDKEKQTIDALLSQWTEEDVPESELTYSMPQTELPCFNSTVIAETSQIFQPITAIMVPSVNYKPNDPDSVIIELGKPSGESPVNVECTQDVNMDESHRSTHGGIPEDGEFLPVEGGYLIVNDNTAPGQTEIPDLDEIERELRMLDEQILQIAQCNNINAEAVLASTETTVSNINEDSSASCEVTGCESQPQRMFSIFSNPNPGITMPTTKDTSEKAKKILRAGSNQYVIDAGQKQFGATQCSECGVIYQIGDPQDEHDHLVHHNAVDVLKFNGWKEECVVGRQGDGRCLRVRGGDAGWRRVVSVLQRVVHPQLGYAGDLPRGTHEYTAYLYIEKKQIVGCLIVEPKIKGYKMIPGDPDCCSIEDYPVKCGISRLWIHTNFRRRGLATLLLECARASFFHGAALPRAALAFSAPTPAGKALATAYCGTPNFYVYLD